MIYIRGELQRCWCGQPAHGEVKGGGKFRYWCKDHVPEHVQRFRENALLCLQRGRAKRLAARKLKDFWVS